jgi:hypothetical protein
MMPGGLITQNIKSYDKQFRYNQAITKLRKGG